MSLVLPMKISQLVRMFILAAPLSGAAAAADDSVAALNLVFPAFKPEVYERVEIAVSGMPAAANPFDPEVVALDAEVAAPSGKVVRVPGFFEREFSRKLEGGREVLEGGAERWRIRWLPVEPGRHTLSVRATLAGRIAARGEAVIEAVPGKRHGLASVDPMGMRSFRLDDGTPLFLEGLCMCCRDQTRLLGRQQLLAPPSLQRHQRRALPAPERVLHERGGPEAL
jgi:hypothetical protein